MTLLERLVTDEVALIGSVLTIKIWAKCMVGSL